MGLFLCSDTINWCLKACEATWEQQATSVGGNNLQASSSLYCHPVAALVKYGIFQAVEIPEENRR